MCMKYACLAISRSNPNHTNQHWRHSMHSASLGNACCQSQLASCTPLSSIFHSSSSAAYTKAMKTEGSKLIERRRRQNSLAPTDDRTCECLCCKSSSIYNITRNHAMFVKKIIHSHQHGGRNKNNSAASNNETEVCRGCGENHRDHWIAVCIRGQHTSSLSQSLAAGSLCWSSVDRLSTCTELVVLCDVLPISAASASPSSHADRNVTSETDRDVSVWETERDGSSTSSPVCNSVHGREWTAVGASASSYCHTCTCHIKLLSHKTQT